MRSDLTRTLERIENAVAEHKRADDISIFFVSGPAGADGVAFLETQGRLVQSGDIVVKFVRADRGRPVDEAFADLTDEMRHRAVPTADLGDIEAARRVAFVLNKAERKLNADGAR